MSFLNEDDATLAEAFAFLDEFYQSTDTNSSIDFLNPSSKSRIRDPSVYVRRRQRKKLENQALRQLVLDLESKLRATRRAVLLSPSASRSTSKWLKIARKELKRRIEAEETNLQLKNSLVTQIWFARVLQEGGGDNLWSASIYGATNVASITAELRATTERLFVEVSGMNDDQMAVADFMCESSLKTDPVVGIYAESKAAAPLGKSLAFAADLLQSQFVNPQFGQVTATFALTYNSSSDRQMEIREKRGDVDLSIGGALVRFRCIGILSMHQLDDRIVFTYAVLLFHPSGKFCFREGGWLIVQALPENKNLSYSRTCSRVAGGICGDKSIVDGLVMEHMESSSIAALGARTRTKHQSIHRKLLVATGREDLARLLPLEGEQVVNVPAWS